MMMKMRMKMKMKKKKKKKWSFQELKGITRQKVLVLSVSTQEIQDEHVLKWDFYSFFYIFNFDYYIIFFLIFFFFF